MIIEIIIILLIFLLSIILIHRNLNLAIRVLLILSVLLHKEVFSIYSWDLLPVRFFVLALAGYIVVKEVILTKHNDIKAILISYLKDPFVLILVLLWLVRGVSIIYTKNLKASLYLYSFFSTMVVMGIYFYYKFLGDTKELTKLIRFYTYIVFGICLFGFLQLFLYFKYNFIIGALWNVPGHFPRVGSTFWDVNHFGALLASLLPILGVFILIDKGIKQKALNTVILITLTGFLFITSSRTSWITALVSFLAFTSLLLIRKFKARGLSYLLGVIILILIPLVREYSIKSSPFRAYVKDNFHYRLDSFASHIMLLKGSYQIFEKYPILGGGYGSFFEHFRITKIAADFFSRDPAALNTRVPAHTIWGEALSETGMTGFLLTLIFSIFLLSIPFFGALNSSDRRDYLPLMAIFSTYLGLFVAGIFYSYNSEFYWLILFIYFIYSLSVIKEKYNYADILEYYVKATKLHLLFIILVCSLLIFVNLGVNHLVPWDEAIYAKIAKNMLLSKDFLNMYWKSGIVWYEKPPFYLWAVTFFMKTIGANAWAARLPSAISGLFTVVFVYIFAKRYFSKITAFLSAFALVMGVHFLYYSRAAMIDVMATLFISSSLFLYYYIKNSKNYYWNFLPGVLAGCAVMTKGVVGILPVFIIIIYEIYLIIINKKINYKEILGILIYFIGLTLVATPWHLFMYQKYGRLFFDQYILYHVVSRAATAIEDKGKPIYWYFIVMKVSMRIWFIPLIIGFPYFVYKTFKKDTKYAFLTIWVTVILVIFSIAKSKLVWYIIPIYPALCIISGHFIYLFYNFLSSRFKILTKLNIKFLLYSLLVIFSFAYLFFYRKLIFTSDLTGDAAELLIEKDSVLGTDDLIYVDRVEVPIILFYSESPYKVIDFDPSKGRVPLMFYDKRIIILGKAGRFTENIPIYNKPPQIIDRRGDYILWYYESNLKIDKNRLEELDKELGKFIKSTKPSDIIRSEQLRKEMVDLLTKVKVFEDIPVSEYKNYYGN